MKKLVALTLAAVMLLTAGVAMASPDVKLDGDLKVHYRWNTADGAADTEGGKVWFRLNAKTALSDSVDAYARFSSQSLTGDLVGADFDQSYQDYKADGLSVFDRYGVIIKGKNFTYNVGRQGATIGATALLYSTEGYTGINMGALDGVVVNGKAGVTNLKFVAGKQWSEGSADSKVYAVEASYSPAKNWTVGAVLGKVAYDGLEDTNHWAVNTGYAVGKANFAAEYAKSNVDIENTAYAVGVNYAFDKKHSAYAYYSKVETFGDMSFATDFDNTGKGIYLGYDYKLRKDTTFSLFYKDMETTIGGINYDSLRTTVTYKF